MSAALPIADELRSPGQLAGTKPGNTDSRQWVLRALLSYNAACNLCCIERAARKVLGNQIDMLIKKLREKTMRRACVCVSVGVCKGKPNIFSRYCRSVAIIMH